MKIIDNIAALVKVKTIVTFAVVAVYCYLSIVGKIPTDNVQTVAMMVVAFYFGTQTEKKAQI